MNPDLFSRRQFIRQACCSAVGSVGLLSTLAQLRMMGAVAADSSDVSNPMATSSGYKALVCVFLTGGNDANNVIVPYDATDYAAYAAARGILAVPQSTLLPISTSKYRDGRQYALSPYIPEIQSLYTQGKVALMANVGTLVQPTTLSQYNSGTALPPQLYSHSDQLLQWQSSVPDQPFTTGWGGRLADLMNALNSNNQISMSISLGGSNSFQVANSVSEYSVAASGPASLTFGTGSNVGTRHTAFTNIMGAAQSNLIEAAFATTTQMADTDSQILNATLKSAPVLKTVFPTTSFGEQMQMIANLISVAPSLGLMRQIFFIQLYGWDLHASQVVSHPPLLTELSGALGAFYQATTELGVANQVTTFTASDFGRTYGSNGSGSDHGWGNHQIIMGGAVQGGDIYGTMPSLVIGGPDDTGRGRWLPSTSVDEYSATLATWFGVSSSNLSTVLPNIGRFSHPNLGFMG